MLISEVRAITVKYIIVFKPVQSSKNCKNKFVPLFAQHYQP